MGIERVGVIGAGQMGSGIAEVSAKAGADVLVYEPTDELVAAGNQRLTQSLERAAAKGKSFYHIIVNSKGGIFDWMGGNRKFDTAARIKIRLVPDHYAIECAIPFDELRKVGVEPSARFVKMNVMRNYNGGERLHDPAITSSWYFTRGSNLHLDSRGWLCLVP